MELQDKHFVLGLAGGIACYKSAELVRLLTKAGATVQVVMTEAAMHFITSVTIQTFSDRLVFTSQWNGRTDDDMPHIDPSRKADAIVIAPASIDFMAELVRGMADDLLSTLCIVRDCPLLMTPVMNQQIWVAPVAQRNAVQLRVDDITLLGPDAGDQACGEVGDGRMLEPEDIVEQLVSFFQPKLLRGRRVLLTAGPTLEPVDLVRGITNLSGGRMGFALARATSQAGAEVTPVAGSCHQDIPAGILRTDMQTAQQVHDAVMYEPNTAKSDIFIAVVVVADWRVAQVAEHRFKEQSDADMPSPTFTQNPDILAAVTRRPNAPFCVSSTAETERLEGSGEVRRQRRGIPLLVGNLDHRTFGHDDNEVTFLGVKRITRLLRTDKLTLARQIVVIIVDRVYGTQS